MGKRSQLVGNVQEYRKATRRGGRSEGGEKKPRNQYGSDCVISVMVRTE